LQRVSVAAQAGVLHDPVVGSQRPAVTQVMPRSWKPVRSPLQIWGCAATQRVWFGWHDGSVQVPVVALHSATLAQSVPMLVKPVRSLLQT